MAGDSLFFVSTSKTTVNYLNRNVFGPAGYVVRHFTDWTAAHSAAEESPPGVFLISDVLPDVSCFDVVQILSKAFPAVPVVLFAPEQKDPALLRRALRHGAADCILSPIQPEEVLHTLEACMRNRQTWVEGLKIQPENDTDLASRLGRRVDELEKILIIGQSLTGQLSLDAVLTQVVRTAVQLTNAEEGSLMLFDEATQELYIRAAYNLSDDFVKTFRLAAKDTLAGKVIATAEPVIFGRQTPEKIKTHYLVHSLIYVPLLFHGRVTGVLGVDNRKLLVHFEDRHVEQLATLAGFAAIAIENASLYEKLAAERNDLETILARVADGVLVVDAEGKLVFANRPAHAVFHDPVGSYTGRSAQEVINQAGLLQVIQKLLAGEAIPSRFEFMSSDALHFVAQFAQISGLGLIVTMQDVTHFKDLDRIKTEFIHTVSHDLRSPLTAIMGYVELIGRAGQVNDLQKEYIRRVHTSVRNITSLINDLLELGRIESGVSQQITSLPVPVVLGMVLDELQPMLEEKEHTVATQTTDQDIQVQGDASRLRQMLFHLLDNAIKYTPNGGQITFSLSKESGQAVVQIKDNGIGIPPGDQPYIFNKLYRGSNVPANVPGSGLGLAIVKAIVEMHDGRFWFESTLNQGSTFTVLLPLAKSPED